MKHTNMKTILEIVQFNFFSEKIVGKIDLSQYQRGDTSHHLILYIYIHKISTFPIEKMDMLF